MEDMNVMENYEAEEMVNYESNDSNSDTKRGFGTVVCGAILTIGGVGYYLWKKNRDKAETKKTEKDIARLEALGYTVIKNPEPEVEDNNDSDVEEITEE